MGKIKARRTNREELPGIAVLRDSVAGAMPAFSSIPRVLDLDMEVEPTLSHLITHDPDGFFTAIDRDETVGFASAHIRSRQWVLSELWVLPQHRGKGAGEVLLKRVLTYGVRSGARQFMALVPADPAIQGLLLRHGFVARTPVYLFTVEAAEELSRSLTRLLPGQDVTAELLNRRGHADLDRIDRLTRNINRETDHDHWLKECGLSVAFVRQGTRIAAYAYGGSSQVGPVAGSTQEAALSALGWSIRLALARGRQLPIVVQIPATFGLAIEALQEAGSRVHATMMLYRINLSLSFDRYVFGPPNLP